jgi:3-dehydroquinate synthase
MNTECIYSGEESRWLALENQPVFILCDARTNGFCIATLMQHMPFLSKAKRIVVPAGESAKQWDVCLLIWEALIQEGAQSNAVMLVLGGGALCDVGAFCASVYKRGIRLRLIPTTLLAMVDASLGGKTAINFQGIKNNIGSFYSAEAVYYQPHFFQTLPIRELHSGIAEMVKHGLLDSAETWQKIQSYVAADFYTLPAIKASQAIKNRFVSADPTDQGIRQALNFGHSIGHAIEACSLETVTPWLHGEAIMLGMQIELWLSVKKCSLPITVYNEFVQMHQRIFPYRLPFLFNEKQLLAVLMHDKKNRDSIRMSLISSPGVPQIQVSVEESLITEAIHENRYQ